MTHWTASTTQVDYFKFSLSEPKLVGHPDCAAFSSTRTSSWRTPSGTVLASDRETGTTKEWISVGLNPGQYFLRVLARSDRHQHLPRSAGSHRGTPRHYVHRRSDHRWRCGWI